MVYRISIPVKAGDVFNDVSVNECQRWNDNATRHSIVEECRPDKYSEPKMIRQSVWLDMRPTRRVQRGTFGERMP
jgi:hypothetical protein